jgi:hypothetical protein
MNFWCRHNSSTPKIKAICITLMQRLGLPHFEKKKITLQHHFFEVEIKAFNLVQWVMLLDSIHIHVWMELKIKKNKQYKKKLRTC